MDALTDGANRRTLSDAREDGRAGRTRPRLRRRGWHEAEPTDAEARRSVALHAADNPVGYREGELLAVGQGPAHLASHRRLCVTSSRDAPRGVIEGLGGANDHRRPHNPCAIRLNAVLWTHGSSER